MTIGGFGVYGLSGKDLIIARDREHAYTMAREVFIKEIKKGMRIKLKLTSGKGKSIKTYRVNLYKKEEVR